MKIGLLTEKFVYCIAETNWNIFRFILRCLHLPGVLRIGYCSGHLEHSSQGGQGERSPWIRKEDRFRISVQTGIHAF